MVSVLALWLPILVAAVLVFFVSFVLHTVLKYHRTDFRPLPDEDAVMAALRPFEVPPGNYVMPFMTGAEMKDPEFQAKVEKGPVAFITLLPTGMPTMGKSLAQWFVYCVVVGIFAAYVAGRALGPGSHYLEVFRFVGTTAFCAYSLALVQSSIWYKRNWPATLKSMADGLVYALVSAGVFGWLWPGA